MNARLREMIERVKEPLANVALIAHRGGSQVAPENTIPAFESAVSIGADMVELDVHLTKDNKLVVHHNVDTEWLGCHNIVLAESEYTEILKCKFDALFGEKFENIHIPLLEDVLMILKGNTIPVIEIKMSDSYREKTEGILIDMLKDFNLIGESVIVSFSKDVLRRVKEKEPKTFVGFITASAGDFPEGIEALVVFFRILKKNILDNLHQSGKTVFVWTINEEKNMRKYIQMGLDGIASDDPILLKKVLTGHY